MTTAASRDKRIAKADRDIAKVQARIARYETGLTVNRDELDALNVQRDWLKQMPVTETVDLPADNVRISEDEMSSEFQAETRTFLADEVDETPHTFRSKG